MMNLWCDDTAEQSNICEKLYKDKSRVTRVIDNLIEKGLINKEINKEDRRRNILRITPKGTELKEKIQGPLEEIFSIIGEDLTSNDFKTTLTTVSKIFDKFDSVK